MKLINDHSHNVFSNQNEHFTSKKIPTNQLEQLEKPCFSTNGNMDVVHVFSSVFKNCATNL